MLREFEIGLQGRHHQNWWRRSWSESPNPDQRNIFFEESC